MKRWLLLLFGALIAINAHAQLMPGSDKMVRIYEDNDFLNVRGMGTDEGYTNGTRLDYFYIKKRAPRFLDKWILPRAGRSAVSVSSWSLMQIMITPENLSDSNYIPNDYPYSGALFLSHGLSSYNAEKKYGFQTELIMGVMGPLSLAKEAQKLIHHMIGYRKPRGWRNQLPNDPLLNYNFTAEKMLWQPGSAVELLGGASAYAGTMLDGLSVHGMVRAGYMDPYFGISGSAPPKKFQVYAFLRSTAELVFYNALLEGGVFSHRDGQFEKVRAITPPAGINKLTTHFDYGLTVTYRRWALSYTQTTQSPSLKGNGRHEVGNISLYVPL